MSFIQTVRRTSLVTFLVLAAASAQASTSPGLGSLSTSPGLGSLSWWSWLTSFF